MEKLEFEFDDWFNLFTDKVRQLGWMGPIDKETFHDNWESGETPEEAAKAAVGYWSGDDPDPLEEPIKDFETPFDKAFDTFFTELTAKVKEFNPYVELGDEDRRVFEAVFSPSDNVESAFEGFVEGFYQQANENLALSLLKYVMGKEGSIDSFSEFCEDNGIPQHALKAALYSAITGWSQGDDSDQVPTLEELKLK